MKRHFLLPDPGEGLLEGDRPGFGQIHPAGAEDADRGDDGRQITGFGCADDLDLVADRRSVLL